MLVDTDWLVENFYYLNKDYFNGRLPIPQLKVNYSDKYFGQCSSYGGISRNGKWVREPLYMIIISNYWKRNEGDFLNTLLHEMIHLYFYQKNMDVGHGAAFQRMARSFDKYGFDVHTKSNIRTSIRPDFLHRHPKVLGVEPGGTKGKNETSPNLTSLMFYPLLILVLYIMTTSDLPLIALEVIKELTA